MAKWKGHHVRLKWNDMGFVPEGWDDTRTIKYGDEGFLYLCQALRADWRNLMGYRIRDLKHKPRGRSGTTSFYFDGLDEALNKRGANLSPPPTVIMVTPRKPGPEEREQLGRTAHQNWVAVRRQHRATGNDVADLDLRPWNDRSDDEREVFRRSGESLAVPDEMMWEAVQQMRQKMGEKAFRKKMFELSVSVAFERMNPNWSDAERYRATDMIVKLSEMLDVPPGTSNAAVAGA